MGLVHLPIHLSPKTTQMSVNIPYPYHPCMIYLPTFTMKKINQSCIGKERSVWWKFMGYKNEHLRESQVFGAHLVCRIPHRVVVDSGRGTFGQSLALFAPQLLRSEGPGGGKMGNPVASRILNLSTLQTFEKMTQRHASTTTWSIYMSDFRDVKLREFSSPYFFEGKLDNYMLKVMSKV